MRYTWIDKYPIVGQSVLVEFPNGWLPAEVIGFSGGDLGEDFDRVNVVLETGRRVAGCHPDCIKEVSP